MIKGVLFQESLYREPFWMLIACSLVNMTRWMQAEPVFEAIRAKYPTPEDLAKAGPEELMPMVKCLGFGSVRSVRLALMAQCWIRWQPKTASDVKKMAGCGQYASDSWAIFVDGDLNIAPKDVELQGYLRRIRSESDR